MTNFFRRQEAKNRPFTNEELAQKIREKEQHRRAISTPQKELCVGKKDRWVVRFAGFEFGASYEGNHGVIGSIGSGKSLILDRYTLDVAKVCYPGSGNFACVIDTKGTIPQMLHKNKTPFKLLNLSDVRSVSIDAKADCESDPATIGEFIHPLVRDDEKNAFWSNSTRGYLVSVARALDAIGCLSISSLYRAVTLPIDDFDDLLSRHPSNALFQRLLWHQADDKLRGNISSGVAATLEPFTLAAANDYHAKERISLKKELEEGGVLVIGIDMARINLSLPFYHMILNRLINLILSRSDYEIRGSSFLILDEIPVLKRIEGLPQLLSVGRSKKCHVAYSVQQTKQLDSFYSEGEVASIFGNTDNICFLRSNDPESEELLSKRFGEALNPQVSYSQGSDSYSRSVEYVSKPRIVPGALGRLPAPTPATGIHFYMDSRYFPSPIPHPFKLPGEWIEANKPEVDRNYPSLILKPPLMNIIPPFTEAEADALLRETPPLEIPLPVPRNELEKLIFQEMKRYVEQLSDQFILSLQGGES